MRMQQGTGLIGVQSTRAYAALEELSRCVIPSWECASGGSSTASRPGGGAGTCHKY